MNSVEKQENNRELDGGSESVKPIEIADMVKQADTGNLALMLQNLMGMVKGIDNKIQRIDNEIKGVKSNMTKMTGMINGVDNKIERVESNMIEMIKGVKCDMAQNMTDMTDMIKGVESNMVRKMQGVEDRIQGIENWFEEHNRETQQTFSEVCSEVKGYQEKVDYNLTEVKSKLVEHNNTVQEESKHNRKEIGGLKSKFQSEQEMWKDKFKSLIEQHLKEEIEIICKQVGLSQKHTGTGYVHNVSGATQMTCPQVTKYFLKFAKQGSDLSNMTWKSNKLVILKYLKGPAGVWKIVRLKQPGVFGRKRRGYVRKKVKFKQIRA